MELRIFQIIVPTIALFYGAGLIFRFRKSQITIYELMLGLLFWLAVLLVAIFPDFFSNQIARLFGIKSNINAIIFFCLGILFFTQFKLYFIIRRQQQDLTQLTRALALQDKIDSPNT